MAGFVDNLREGRWLSRERVRLVALMLLAAALIGAAFLIVTSNGLNDRFGRPLGTDFSNVYAAGTYVLDGEAGAPSTRARNMPASRRSSARTRRSSAGITRPSSSASPRCWRRCPIGWRCWCGRARRWALSLGDARRSLAQRHSRGKRRSDYGFCSRSPSRRCSSISATATTAFSPPRCLAGALLQLDRRPIVAGILIGLLAYKPQFGLLIPLVLIAGGHWRAFAAAAATVAVLALAVTFAFGVDVWTAFLASTHFTRTVVLEQGDTGWHKIQSVFSLVRMWGGGIDARLRGARRGDACASPPRSPGCGAAAPPIRSRPRRC